MNLPIFNHHQLFESKESLLQTISKHGFFYLKTDVYSQVLFKSSEEFFTKSVHYKSQYPYDPTCNSGWIHNEVLNVKQLSVVELKEAFNVPDSFDMNIPNEYPREEIQKFMNSCRSICLDILNALESALEIKDASFIGKHNSKSPSGTTLRFLYYPTLPMDESINQEKFIRAGAHTDYGSLTLLFVKDNVQGLEIFDVESNEFKSVIPIPGTILVNTGDLMEFWTNGVFKSSIHRVVFHQNCPRYSIAYFFHPDDDAVLHPIHSPLISNTKTMYHTNSELYTVKEDVHKSLTAKQHLILRLSQSHS